jgi:hypothetical protein
MENGCSDKVLAVEEGVVYVAVYINTGHYKRWDSGLRELNVTHWMPIPEPPKQ